MICIYRCDLSYLCYAFIISKELDPNQKIKKF